VRSTIDLGHNLGLEVVSEGVEDEATATRLRELGCDVAQGYWFAQPMNAQALTAWLDARAVTLRTTRRADRNASVGTA
jgi:EAL domain-containing protein (putative c-di-GMP-specific phosphodiesterase class I)